MPSLTPLHETYCKWDRSPPSQADVLEGLAQLVSTRLNGVVQDLIQAMQREILLSIFGVSTQKTKRFQKAAHIDKVYQYIYGVIQKYGTQLVAPGLRQIIDMFPNLHDKPLNSTLHFLIGALNGVLGDYLLARHNPLALPMVLYDHYGALQQGDLNGRVVIFVHGLCMNHQDWSPANGGIGEKLLAQRDNNTMLYLNYNTGRRISANGRSLSNLLEELVKKNPRITSIDLVGHSMGGLVLRSALFYGKQNMYQWFHMTENLVCLGSPHHGAVLERFGFALQEKFGNFPIMKLVSHVVNIRSNGILDLRYGSVRDDDWEHNDIRIGLIDDNRKPAPLPSHLNTFLVAGTIEFENKKNLPLKIIGDYLVSIKSALGEHPNPRFQLKLPLSHKAVFYGLNHFDIQYHSSVAEQVAKWFYPRHDELAQEQISKYLVKLESMQGIVET
ncbi:PGAP1-like protein [Acinetobacter calcoaceticus]|uniref:PGAP1-like protein n=1 Tax=Acinetobacter calcoaceticus TaxID=471 RepID=A0A4R1XVW7_ACICA|nr:PGAP1-like protein [Acinetobacter calcoaceticus]